MLVPMFRPIRKQLAAIGPQVLKYPTIVLIEPNPESCSGGYQNSPDLRPKVLILRPIYALGRGGKGRHTLICQHQSEQAVKVRGDRASQAARINDDLAGEITRRRPP